MAKGDICKVIIKDDFNNVLVIQKKVKKGEKSIWSLSSKELKGRETEEKCANRAIKEDLKTIVFDLVKFKEQNLDEVKLTVYIGSIKERVSSNDNVEKLQWISKDSIDDFDIDIFDKDILKDFFSSQQY